MVKIMEDESEEGVGLRQESKEEGKQKMRSRAGHVQVGGFHVDPVIARSFKFWFHGGVEHGAQMITVNVHCFYFLIVYRFVFRFYRQ